MVSTITDRLQGFSIGAAIKAPIYVATTGANITLSGAQTIDGIAVGSCQRVLVKDQDDAVENGIYISDSSTWVRAADADGNRDVKPGTITYVDRGAENRQSFWVFNSSSTALDVVFGTDSVNLSQVNLALAGVSDFAQGLLDLNSTAAWQEALEVGATQVQAFSTSIAFLNVAQNWLALQTFGHGYIVPQGADIASDSSIGVGTTANYYSITGESTISTIVVSSGHRFTGVFTSSAVMAHGATTIILPGSANIVAAAGDAFEGYAIGPNQVRVLKYLPASGQSVVAGGETVSAYIEVAEVLENADGPSYAAGAFRTVPFNTKVHDESSIASLSSDMVEIPAGTYDADCRFMVQDYNGSGAQNYASRLLDVGATATLITGVNHGMNYPQANAGMNAMIHILGRFVLTSSAVVSAQMYPVQATDASSAVSGSSIEVYSRLCLWKVSTL